MRLRLRRRNEALVNLEQRFLRVIADAAVDDFAALIQDVEHPMTIFELVPVERRLVATADRCGLGSLVGGGDAFNVDYGAHSRRDGHDGGERHAE